MDPPPDFGYDDYKGTGKLKNKVNCCHLAAPPAVKFHRNRNYWSSGVHKVWLCSCNMSRHLSFPCGISLSETSTCSVHFASSGMFQSATYSGKTSRRYMLSVEACWPAGQRKLLWQANM